MEENKAFKSTTWLQRINYAWNPIIYSLSVPVFGFATVMELVGSAFEWQKRLDEMGYKWIPTVNIVVYVVLTLWAARSVFLIAERCGKSQVSEAKALTKATNHVEALSCIHDVIHATRDDLLSSNNFIDLIQMDDDLSTRHLFETWNTQLALLQRAMRQLTASECHVCIKGLVAGSGPDGLDGLKTLCYGPAVSSERRRKSLILPMNQGIASEAIISRGISYSNDILADDRYWPRAQRDENAKIYRTVVSAPIFFNRAPFGVLCLDWKEPNRYEHDAHCNVVSSFTDMVGTANYLHRISRALRKVTGEA